MFMKIFSRGSPAHKTIFTSLLRLSQETLIGQPGPKVYTIKLNRGPAQIFDLMIKTVPYAGARTLI